ncbi:hypothetical protein CYMTET_55465 [Cymbomonas tetramitiformis]|uniref:Uncharacterized protein n=1 Tax=Cymbomonas tetramitiformis TaxID=36881 RepID=A0AAE0BER9_9CHLO|nr:hypothetical protein CYMTET_55465 [Cymbomonas tetramitiformis]
MSELARQNKEYHEICAMWKSKPTQQGFMEYVQLGGALPVGQSPKRARSEAKAPPSKKSDVEDPPNDEDDVVVKKISIGLQEVNRVAGEEFATRVISGAIEPTLTITNQGTSLKLKQEALKAVNVDVHDTSFPEAVEDCEKGEEREKLVRFLTKTNKYARMEDSDEESEEPPMPAETPMPANTAAATEDLPELHEVFPIGAEVVVYAGAQEEADEVELENRPNFDKIYAPNGNIRKQIALVAGLVVANKVNDLVTDHLTMGAEYDLQEGQLGIKVTGVSRLFNRSKLWEKAVHAVSAKMFRKVDAVLPAAIATTHRIALHGSIGQKTYLGWFQGKKVTTGLVVDSLYVRKGNVDTCFLLPKMPEDHFHCTKMPAALGDESNEEDDDADQADADKADADEGGKTVEEEGADVSGGAEEPNEDVPDEAVAAEAPASKKRKKAVTKSA